MTAETVQGDEFMKSPIINSEMHTELTLLFKKTR